MFQGFNQQTLLFFFLLYLLLFLACVHVCLCLCGCTHLYMQKPEIDSGAFSHHLPLYSLKQGLSLHPELTNSKPPCSRLALSLPPMRRDYRQSPHLPNCAMGSQYPNSGLYACAASTLPTQPAPQPRHSTGKLGVTMRDSQQEHGN